MRLSTFTCLKEFDGEFYLVNTLTRAVAQVSPYDLERVKSTEFKPSNEEDAELVNQLIGDWYIVDEMFDETSLVRYYINKLKYFPNEAGIDSTILTTYSCNLACKYCYESGVKENKIANLSKETSDRTIEWLDNFAMRKEVDKIFVDFYGGEPLLNTKIMEYFMKRAKLSSYTYSFSAVTNGVFLTKELVSSFKPLGFSSVQITLDGPKEIHDQRRITKSGKGTFDVIFKNILDAVDDIGIGLSINKDRHNVNRIPEFLDILTDVGLKDKIVLAFNIVARAPCDLDHCREFIFTDEELSVSQSKLYKIASEKGFSIQHRVDAGVCRSQHECNVVIDPFGDIYPCPATVGIDQFRAGNVIDPFHEFYKGWSKFVGAEPWDNDECKACEYLPLCLGGCRHVLFTEKGKTQGPMCRKQSYDGDLDIIIMRALHESSKEITR